MASFYEDGDKLRVPKRKRENFFDYLNLLKNVPAPRSSQNIQGQEFTYQQTFMKTPFNFLVLSFFNGSVYRRCITIKYIYISY
jgi:hypothetical protein